MYSGEREQQDEGGGDGDVGRAEAVAVAGVVVAVLDGGGEVGGSGLLAAGVHGAVLVAVGPGVVVEHGGRARGVFVAKNDTFIAQNGANFALKTHPRAPCRCRGPLPRRRTRRRAARTPRSTPAPPSRCGTPTPRLKGDTYRMYAVDLFDKTARTAQVEVPDPGAGVPGAVDGGGALLGVPARVARVALVALPMVGVLARAACWVLVILIS